MLVRVEKNSASLGSTDPSLAAVQCGVIKFNFRIPLFYLSLFVLLSESCKHKHNSGKSSLQNWIARNFDMRNEIIKWNPAFFGRALHWLWSIYSYFGIVWKQNIMNKLNLLKVQTFRNVCHSDFSISPLLLWIGSSLNYR